MPTINLDDDELAAVTATIRRTIEDDRYPHAPRLDPLRAALGSTRRLQSQHRSRRGRRPPKPTRGRGPPRRPRLRSRPASSWAGGRPTADPNHGARPVGRRRPAELEQFERDSDALRAQLRALGSPS
jgi:hypothetical protein